MIEISADELVRATGARMLVAPAPGRRCRGVCIDSREAGPGTIFVAFPGEHVDGNDFIPAAICAGAACAVCTGRRPQEALEDLMALARGAGCALVHADDPEAFLLELAAWWRGRLDAQVVGITGSIGKTTTKDLLAELLRARYRVHATRGNLNNQIGLPLTVLSAPATTEVLVVEMGMSALGEIERLSRCARPTVGIITKVGTSHVGLLGSRVKIADAKGEIVLGMEPGSTLVLCGEDDFFDYLCGTAAAPRGLRVLPCGSAAGDAVRATEMALDEDGHPSFTLSLPGQAPVRCALSTVGAQSVKNAVLAAGAAHELGVTAAEMQAAFARVRLTGRRQEIRRTARGARVIDDSYNASPESTAAGLDLLAQLPCTGERVAVLGEMGELGEAALDLHRLVGAYAAAKKPAELVCVGGGLARAMAEAACLMGMDEASVQVFPSTDALIAGAPRALGAGDVALVKGSRFVGLDRFVEEVCQDVR